MISAKPAKEKACKCCKALFMPQRMGAKVCSPFCALTFAKSVLAKAEKVAQVKERREDKAKREKMKKRSEWIKECQPIANRVARLRDALAGHGCISCGAKPSERFGGAMDGGHFRSVGSAVHMRFFLPNISAQCVRCNQHLGGNAIEYRKGLVARHGLPFVDQLESMQGSPKWSIDWLKKFKRVMLKKARRLERRLQDRALQEISDFGQQQGWDT